MRYGFGNRVALSLSRCASSQGLPPQTQLRWSLPNTTEEDPLPLPIGSPAVCFEVHLSLIGCRDGGAGPMNPASPPMCVIAFNTNHILIPLQSLFPRRYWIPQLLGRSGMRQLPPGPQTSHNLLARFLTQGLTIEEWHLAALLLSSGCLWTSLTGFSATSSAIGNYELAFS